MNPACLRRIGCFSQPKNLLFLRRRYDFAGVATALEVTTFRFAFPSGGETARGVQKPMATETRQRKQRDPTNNGNNNDKNNKLRATP
jgi:hypothetical protein